MNLSSNLLGTRAEAAVAMALAAGEITLRYFRQGNFSVERKSDESPVTVADREAEQFLRSEITRQFPRDAIMGEEFGESPGDSGFRWILDPIDGTKSFIFGVPLYGTMVGVEYQGHGVVGVVNIPALGECVHASQGQGCWYLQTGKEPQVARVSATSRLENGLFVTSQVDTFTRRKAEEAYHRLEQAAFVSRTWGDCYGYLLVATGRAEVMVDPMLNVWDAAAVQPILEEAGGTFTDWRGNRTIHAGEAIGTNGRVLEEVLAITRPFSTRSQ
jgi:histidinol-phosphatase